MHIDGATGEGGGQVLRTSLALAMVTETPIRVTNIRAGRRRPGLRPQHLAGLLAAARISRAEVRGAALGSREVEFVPGEQPRPGQYSFDVSKLAGQSSAGSVSLLLQCLLLPLALADGESELVLGGGTHVPFSPPVDYLIRVLLPTLRRAGLEAEVDIQKWGWFPRGGGRITVRIAGGAKLRGLDFTNRGSLQSAEGLATVSNLPDHVGRRMADALSEKLPALGASATVRVAGAPAPSPGAAAFVELAYEGSRAGFCALGRRGLPAEEVAGLASTRALEFHRLAAALDRHLPDQLLPFLAVAEGSSTLTTAEITSHSVTNSAIVRRFLPRSISIDGPVGEPGTIHID